MGLFAKDTKEQAFWKWFVKNQEEIHDFEKDREAVFGRLSKAMNQVHEDLTFEFSPVREDGKREFIISAGGIRDAFLFVESLALSAPELKQWEIVKFRQRRFPLSNLKFGGKEVKADDDHYAIYKDDDPAKVGIMVFLDGYSEDELSTWSQIGYLFLDEAIGEFDVETHVGEVVFLGWDSEYFEHASPIAELPAHFDKCMSRNTEGRERDNGGQQATSSESK